MEENLNPKFPPDFMIKYCLSNMHDLKVMSDAKNKMTALPRMILDTKMTPVFT